MEFLRANKFWVTLAGVGLIAVVMFVLGPVRMMRKNSQKVATLASRASELQNYQNSQIKNPRWVEQQEEIAAQVEKQLKQIKEDLISRDQRLERYFRDPDLETDEPLGPGRWPAHYREKMDELRERLEEGVVKLRYEEETDPLVEAQLPSRLMERKRIHWLEKRYWVQESVVDTVVEMNSGGAAWIPVFGTFRFNDFPDVWVCESHMEKFATIPFSVELGIGFESLPRFLKRLLEVPYGLEITSLKAVPYYSAERVSMEEEREEWSPAAYEPVEYGHEEEYEDEEQTEEERMIEEDTLVWVQIRGYAPDYLQPGEVPYRPPTEEEEGEEDWMGGFGGMGPM